MVDSVLSCLTKFRANLPDSIMNSFTCTNSAWFSWFVLKLFSITNKRSLVVKLFKFAGKYLYLASTNIGRTKRSGKNFRNLHIVSLPCSMVCRWSSYS